MLLGRCVALACISAGCGRRIRASWVFVSNLSRIFYAAELRSFQIRCSMFKLLSLRFVVLGRQERKIVDENDNLGEKKLMVE